MIFSYSRALGVEGPTERPLGSDDEEGISGCPTEEGSGEELEEEEDDGYDDEIQDKEGIPPDQQQDSGNITIPYDPKKSKYHKSIKYENIKFMRSIKIYENMKSMKIWTN